MTAINIKQYHQHQQKQLQKQYYYPFNIVRCVTYISCCITILCLLILILLPDNYNTDDSAADSTASNMSQSNIDILPELNSTRYTRTVLKSKLKQTEILFAKKLHTIQSKLKKFAKKETNTISILLINKEKLVQQKRQQLRTIFEKTFAENGNMYLPKRLRTLRQTNSVIGERLIDIKQGISSVSEIITSNQYSTTNSLLLQNRRKNGEQQINDNKTDEQQQLNIIKNIETLYHVINFFHTTYKDVFKEKMNSIQQEEIADEDDYDDLLSANDIWELYHDVVINIIYPFDIDYRYNRIPERTITTTNPNNINGDNNDNNDSTSTIFISIVSYRDSIQCSRTIEDIFYKAKYPQRISIGLVQYNCITSCNPTSSNNNTDSNNDIPDLDCYTLFCQSTIGKEICQNDKTRMDSIIQNSYNSKNDTSKSSVLLSLPQIRVLTFDDTYAFGSYIGRYITSKLWCGEHYYMQINSNMLFQYNWDILALHMLHTAPSHYPIISHYPPPPSNNNNVSIYKDQPTNRLCGPVFTTNDNNNNNEQIISIEGMGIYDKFILDKPTYTPFISSSFFIGHSSLLQSVPYDPFLPWLTIGEDIYMSVRLWTSGYDLFAPTQVIVTQYNTNNINNINKDDTNTTSTTTEHTHTKHIHIHQPKFYETKRSFFLPATTSTSTTTGTLKSQSTAVVTKLYNPIKSMILQRIKYLLDYPESARDMIHTKTLLSAIDLYGVGTTDGVDSDGIYLLDEEENDVQQQQQQRRTVHDYMIAAGINVTTKEITYTEWCENGYPPPLIITV